MSQHPPAQMAFFAAIAAYRAVMQAPGPPGDPARAALIEELFRALGEASRLIAETVPVISESLDRVAAEHLAGLSDKKGTGVV